MFTLHLEKLDTIMSLGWRRGMKGQRLLYGQAIRLGLRWEIRREDYHTTQATVFICYSTWYTLPSSPMQNRFTGRLTPRSPSLSLSTFYNTLSPRLHSPSPMQSHHIPFRLIPFHPPPSLPLPSLRSPVHSSPILRTPSPSSTSPLSLASAHLTQLSQVFA